MTPQPGDWGVTPGGGWPMWWVRAWTGHPPFLRPAALLGVLLADAPITVRSVKADKYAGRFDADVTTGRGVDVAGALVGAGMAVRWDGTGPRPAVPWPPTPSEG